MRRHPTPTKEDGVSVHLGGQTRGDLESAGCLPSHAPSKVECNTLYASGMERRRSSTDFA
ncbi:MAG: hypothetical protein J6X22_04105 [Muribaculaceae bacterium]|nr:hypothetical protein [Muribaculaceae bacterium]